MNDLEINKAVAEKLGHTFEVHPEGFYIVVHPEPFKSCRRADYCNNPADAWPIIEKHGISITYFHAEDEIWQADVPGYREILDKNPLKAAMLCFLEMEI